MPFVGIDFGTTNSALAVAGADGRVALAPLPGPGGTTTTTWRTVLFFEEGSREASAGAPAIERYLAADGNGRLLQSIKSHLSSSAFERTHIDGRPWRLEDLIAVFLRKLRAAAGADAGRRAVIGRPVRYWGAEDEADEARALGRMRAAAASAGFDEAVFDYEPVAAAASFAARLDHDETVLVADFGGGTSDFSLVRVGPGVAPDDASAILATGGVGLGGDAFDARIIDAEVAPALGRGTSYVDHFGAETDIPAWLYNRLRRWHHLSFLKTAETLRLLERIARGAVAAERVDRLVRLVTEDLGLVVHQAVERAKIALTGGDSGALDVDALDLHSGVLRAAFERWIAEDLDAIDRVVDGVLARAGAAPADVDRVFATGGSSLVPAVRARLAGRFGAGKLIGGEELTSVAWGLAARARVIFGGA